MKKLVRLTEGDLHRIVKESVKRMLKEGIENDFEESESPEGDIAEYGERYGILALGYALYEIARNGEVELTWDLARQIWEYGGNV